jgi:hypothetical protein
MKLKEIKKKKNLIVVDIIEFYKTTLRSEREFLQLFKEIPQQNSRIME